MSCLFNAFYFLLCKNYLPYNGDARGHCLCYDTGGLFQNIYETGRKKEQMYESIYHIIFKIIFFMAFLTVESLNLLILSEQFSPLVN